MRADIMTESSGRSKGCGTVLFETSEDAAHAICILNFFLIKLLIYCYKEEKCDVIKIQICEVMRLVSIFRKNKMKNAPLPKISLLVQSDGSI